jgi:hypothetical protein
LEFKDTEKVEFTFYNLEYPRDFGTPKYFPKSIKVTQKLFKTRNDQKQKKLYAIMRKASHRLYYKPFRLTADNTTSLFPRRRESRQQKDEQLRSGRDSNAPLYVVNN